MKRLNRELGGIVAPLIGIGVAVVAIGAVVLFITGGSDPGTAQAAQGKTGFKAQEVKKPVAPNLGAKRQIPAVTKESKEILKGQLIKFHDKNGQVKFKARDQVTGVDAAGRTLYFQPIVMPGPTFPTARQSPKGIKKAGLKPPKMSVKGSRLVVNRGKADKK